MEKFKFVLDSKIKALKQGIIRLQDCGDGQSTSVNENVGFIVDDLRMKQSGMQNTIIRRAPK